MHRIRPEPRLGWRSRSRSTPPNRTWLALRPVFGCQPLSSTPRSPAELTQPKLLRHRRSALRVARRGHRMLARQLPARSILVQAETVGGREVPTQHYPSPSASQTNYVILGHGSPNRNRRFRLAGQFCQRFAKLPKRLKDDRDNVRELIGCDLISPDERGDDFGHEVSITRCRRRLIGHRFVLLGPLAATVFTQALAAVTRSESCYW